MNRREQESYEYLNPVSQGILKRFTTTELTQLKKEQAKTQKTIQHLQQLYLRGGVNPQVILNELEQAQTKAEELLRCEVFTKRLVYSSDQVVASGKEYPLPLAMGQSLIDFAVRDSVMEIRVDVQDSLSHPLEDPNLVIPKYGKVEFVLVGGQLGIKAQYGKEDLESGTTVPTPSPTRISLMKID